MAIANIATAIPICKGRCDCGDICSNCHTGCYDGRKSHCNHNKGCCENRMAVRLSQQPVLTWLKLWLTEALAKGSQKRLKTTENARKCLKRPKLKNVSRSPHRSRQLPFYAVPPPPQLSDEATAPSR